MMNPFRAYMPLTVTSRTAAATCFCAHVPMIAAIEPVIVAKARIMAEDAL